MKLPRLLFADDNGKIYSHPFLRLAVQSGTQQRVPREEELIGMPAGSTIFYLPGTSPVGFNPDTKRFEMFTEYDRRRVHAVAAFLIPAFLRLYLPAYVYQDNKKNCQLPLWAYTACGAYGSKNYVAAMRIDKRIRQSPRFYDNNTLHKKVKCILKQYPRNRLFKHLSYCALNYNCLAAKNLFLQRWEAPLPTAMNCNARCLGCLSYQPKKGIASHDRIQFAPSVDEISQVLSHHLKNSQEALISFGQGCEGEPLLYAKSISQAVRKVRQRISRGTINMNTNASIPEAIESLCEAGVDSFRVSLNSTRKEYYHRYFSPQGYTFKDVVSSIGIAKKYKKFVSINLFVFPGFTDQEQEVSSLIRFIKKYKIDMVQFRNLNIDPVVYNRMYRPGQLKPLGLKKMVVTIFRTCPELKIGYFNLPKERFRDF